MPATLTRARSLFGIEEELMTLCDDKFPTDFETDVLTPLLEAIARLAPCVRGPSGIFCTYGRVAPDCGHIELSSIEVESPFKLALILDRFHTLLVQAVGLARQQGHPIGLANNNHSGFLHSETGVWGSHENYLVERRPGYFSANILPFLATRLYAGAGGIRFPSGEFVASVRQEFLTCDTGGGTTHSRALHSTCRDESLMDHAAGFRYHGISADGHRSQVNLALQYGATLLAIKTAIFDADLPKELKRLDWLPHVRKWVDVSRHFNLLAKPGDAPRIDPRAIDVQRIYLDAARRFVAQSAESADWMPGILDIWQATLDAWQEHDIEWLAARFDTFTKFKIWDDVLHEMGKSWLALPNDDAALAKLALVGQNYHDFTDPENVFSQLDGMGLLEHRVGPTIPPGGEPEPFVPDVETRARARARLICQRANDPDLIVEWESAHDCKSNQQMWLGDPFAEAYLERTLADELRFFTRHAERPSSRLLSHVLSDYIAGRYEAAAAGLDALWLQAEGDALRCPDNYFRYRAWTQARRGYLDGPTMLEWLRDRAGPTHHSIVDACVTLRFQGLTPPAEIAGWIQIGEADLQTGTNHIMTDEISFHTSRAAWWLTQGRSQEVVDDLDELRRSETFSHAESRQCARMLCTLGEAQRRLGNRTLSGRCFRRADRLYESAGAEGERAELALTGLAKLQQRPGDALRQLAQIRELQLVLRHNVGLVRTMLLEVRRGIDATIAQTYRLQVTQYRDRLPALAACCVLTRILDNWELWQGGQTPPEMQDDYWGL